MADAVPTFFIKVARYRPRFVCFVGVGIWRIVEKALIKLGPRHTDGNMLNLTRPSKSENGKAKKLGATKLGLQPYKLVYDIEASEQTGILSNCCGSLIISHSPSWSRIVGASNIFLCCSKHVWQSCYSPCKYSRFISARHFPNSLLQLADKVKLFIELKAAIDDYQRIDSTRMTTINVSALEAISGVH